VSYFLEVPSVLRTDRMFKLFSPKFKLLNMKSISIPLSSRYYLGKFILLLFMFVLSNSLLAQPSEYLYVYPAAQDAYPGNLNTNLQAIFQQYQVAEYSQAFPGATEEPLSNAYHIYAGGDVAALKTALDQSGSFSSTELSPYSTPTGGTTGCPTGCSNPIQVNDPNQGYQVDITEAGCAWTITQGDPNVVIAVVDTKFDLTNPDLVGKFISMDGANNGNNLHGTEVSGMIVGNHNNNFGIAGLAPDVRLAGYFVYLGIFGYDPFPQVWNAFLDGQKVINFSWGSPTHTPASATITNMVKIMVESGVTFVVAAGNSEPGLPTLADPFADFPGVIMVSSVSSDGTVHEWVDYNEHVDLCAPGNGVACLAPGGTCWGTSMSAPAVCAAIGLMLSVNPCLSNIEIENILKATACPMVDNPIPNWTGAGYMNLYQAVSFAKGLSGSITVSDNWDDDTYINGDIIIETGVTLNINKTVKFAKGSRMIIKPGAIVHLYGKMTNWCDDPWEGVEVWGEAQVSQFTAGHHGKLHLHANAIIENANTAVKLSGAGAGNSGGILYATSADFINNRVSVEVGPYQNFWPFNHPAGWLGQPRNYFCSLQDCEFIVNDDFPNALPINAFVVLDRVKLGAISGCSFVNSRTTHNPMSNKDYGYGIYASDATFNVISRCAGQVLPCNNFDNTLFQGLGYGISVSSSANVDEVDFVNYPYVVQEAVFDKCIYGILNRFVSQGVIIGNTFNLGNLPPASELSTDPYTTQQFGVFFEDGANGFDIQENHFTGTPGNVPNTFGTYCNNIDIFPNEVRKNTYSGVKYGNVADKINALLWSPPQGLVYLCNTNDNAQDGYDFYVFQGAQIRKTQGILVLHPAGDWYRSAGNFFTKSNPPSGDFSNHGSYVVDYHWDNLSDKPQFHFGLTLPYASGPMKCESEYCLPPCIPRTEVPARMASYIDNKTKYLEAKNLMVQASATGNTALAHSKSEEAGAYMANLAKDANLLTSFMSYDTTEYDRSLLRTWWQNMDSPVSDLLVARDYIATGQISQAFSVIDNMPSKFNLTDSQLDDVQAFRDIMELLQGKSAYGLDQSITNQLLNLANANLGHSSAWAKNILTNHGYYFPPTYQIPPSAEYRGDSVKKSNKVTITVSPNPTNNQVNFSWEENNPPSKIVISDAAGRIQWQFEVETIGLGQSSVVSPDMQPGIYFYSAKMQNEYYESGQFVIVK
jgi:hypothetical protein